MFLSYRVSQPAVAVLSYIIANFAGKIKRLFAFKNLFFTCCLYMAQAYVFSGISCKTPNTETCTAERGEGWGWETKTFSASVAKITPVGPSEVFSGAI